MGGRKALFLRSVSVSYVSFGVNALCTLASVPLVLKYISLCEYGLWSVVIQVGIFLGFIDLGVSGALARLMVDAKDHRDTGYYASLYRTACGLFLVFAAATLLLCVASTDIVIRWFSIPEADAESFRSLYLGCGLILSARLLLRPVIVTLLAHQRLDILNMAETAGMLGMMAALWFSLHAGWGILSLLPAQATAAAVSLAICGFAAFHRGFVPKPQEIGQAGLHSLKQLFDLGTQSSLLTVGSQITSLVFLGGIGRWVGIEAIGVWSICSKGYTLLNGLLCRLFDSAVYALMEMHARKEIRQLRTRFEDLAVVTGLLGLAACLAWAPFNRWFIPFWTHGKVSWSWGCDLLLALVTMLIPLHRCFTGLSGVTKQFNLVRWLPWLEAASLTTLTALASTNLGLEGLLAAALICNLLWCGCAGLYSASRQLDIPFRLYWRGWWLRLMLMALTGCGITAVWLHFSHLLPGCLPSLLAGGFLGAGTLVTGYALLLTKEQRAEGVALAYQVFLFRRSNSAD